MNLGLQDKRVLITGGSKGVGLACARAFLAEGARVALVSRSRANLDAARESLGGDTFTMAADLSDAGAAAQMVQQVEAGFGPVDILVNSAGAAQRTPAEELTPAAWHAAMDAKFFSYIHVIDPLVKRMAARGAGVIVNIIGQGGKLASPVHLAGGAANAALMLATAGLAHAYARHGVRVVGLNPGLTNTDRVAEGLRAESRRAGITEQQALEQAVGRLALGRLAEPDEIARIAVFAASAHGTYLTGANITLDGASTPTVV
jgi:NAD(P)-dependent dehydrogenase (short-subunit alcohol dehydrogenase family)